MRRNRVFFSSTSPASLAEPAANGGILTLPGSRKRRERGSKRGQSQQRSSEGAGVSSQEWRRLGRGCGAKLIVLYASSGSGHRRCHRRAHEESQSFVYTVALAVRVTLVTLLVAGRGWESGGVGAPRVLARLRDNASCDWPSVLQQAHEQLSPSPDD